MGKTLIALYGRSNTGKSNTIKLLYELLHDKIEIKEEKVLEERDFYAILKYEGKTVGITSQGDDVQCYKAPFNAFDLHKCAIIICASRTKGESVDYLQTKHKDSELIWHVKVKLTKSNNYNEQRFLSKCTKINQVVAENIIEELNGLIL